MVGTERVLTRGKWRTVEVLACPVTWRPHPEQIASARRGYEDWWQALDWVRDGLIAGGMLREVEVTAAMPKVRPWHSRLQQYVAGSRLNEERASLPFQSSRISAHR